MRDRGKSKGPSFEELRGKVEKWAPPKYQAERECLYGGLISDGVVLDVLMAVELAHGLGEENLRKWQKRCRGERKLIMQKINKLREHPLVMHLGDPIFRRTPLPCPHGRDRFWCEEIGSSIRIYQNSQLSAVAPKRAAERKDEARRFLAKPNLGNPDELDAAKFCVLTDEPELDEFTDNNWFELDPMDRNDTEYRRGGRPPSNQRIEVLDLVMSSMAKSTLSQGRKLGYVASVLQLCFGDSKADGDDLARRWRERKKELLTGPDKAFPIK